MARGNRIVNLLIVSASLLISLGILEIVFRLLERYSQPALDVELEIPESSPISPQEFRILGVGGSTMLADPYDNRFNLLDIVTYYLRKLYPDRRFTQRMVAHKGATLHQLYPHILKALREKPSLLIILSGHNEMIGNFAHDLACINDSMDVYPYLKFSALFRFVLHLSLIHISEPRDLSTSRMPSSA